VKIEFANISEIDRIWPLISADMNAGCTKINNMPYAGQLWQMCRSGGAFLCIVHNEGQILSSSIWRFEDDMSFRCFMLVGNNLKQWIRPLVEFISMQAREGGATTLKTDIRKGWLRFVSGGIANGNTYEVKLDGQQ
jgi:hypothetical protein